jgi:tripartite-type tricarboxylate transporter receptor subunit TctC
MKSIAALTAAAALLFAAPLAAQQQRPMRVILPVSAGSGVDAIVRAAASALSDALAQPVVVENLPGAGGITGTSALVKAAPDGTTVAVVSNNHVTNPAVYKSLPYDSLADITPIAIIGATPFVLVVNPKKLPVNNAKELVALLKANPGKYNYASSGNGTIIHLGGAMFADAAGVEITHVPYKGMGPMISDLMGGQVDLGVASLPSVQGQLKSGALRAIGVTGSQRTPAAPELPTLAEQGLTGMDVAGWFAVVGPARLPASEVKRIHDAFANAYATPAVREAMAKQGNDIHVSTSEEAARFFREETARYAVLVKKIGLTID